MPVKPYGHTPEGIPVTAYTLCNKHRAELTAINYGCTIISLKVPDRFGAVEDIVLGFDALDGYIDSPHYFGAMIGRYANRIAYGQFNLDGHLYPLEKNQPPNHLHGGKNGFDKIIWSAAPLANENGEGVEFRYESRDGQEGYPGNLKLRVVYFLHHDNSVTLDYFATTDQKTIVNLTQHSYFNLNANKENILDHELMIRAQTYLPLNERMIPTGKYEPVEDSPFDFRKHKKIGEDIDADHPQLKITATYDHNWILDKNDELLSHAAQAFDPLSGRVLDVYTTEPGLQLYVANYKNSPVMGRNNQLYGAYCGFCLEAQHFPDSPNQPHFPSVALNPGELYRSTTLWKFTSE